MNPCFSRARTHRQFFWKNCALSPEHRAGVSLHSHSMYSEENLDVLPRYIGKIPIVNRKLDASVNYSRAYWTPPLSPRQAYRLEEKQINRRFDLPGFVSLTDHDDLRAGSMLRVLPRFEEAPLSLEWSVPFGPTIFHIGIHNLPGDAPDLIERLRAFTANPNPTDLKTRLAELHSYPQVLLVLNHPLWDENRIGIAEHRRVLTELWSVAENRLHALEANGLRSWWENREVLKMGDLLSVPVLSGGDRHGCEPNAILNLTAGSTFSEFVEEVRRERQSHLVFMPQYRESWRWRMMQTVVDILRDYPVSFEGRRTWTDRVFCRRPTGEHVSISAIWPNGNAPKIFSAVTTVVKLAQWRGVRSAIKTLLSLQPDREVAV